MKYPLKLIKWQDAYNGNHDWFVADELPKEIAPLVIQTVGWEIQRTDTYVALAMSIADNGQACDMFNIPLAVVVREQTFRSRLK